MAVLRTRVRGTKISPSTERHWNTNSSDTEHHKIVGYCCR